MKQDSEKGGQAITHELSDSQKDFMNSVAVPIIDGTQDERSLENLYETFWDLCQWEKGRADILDTKASYLLGLSSIAAAVVAVGGVRPCCYIAMGLSLGFFTMTVILSLFTLLGKKYGAFNDVDIFNSLRAYAGPIGPIVAFEDKDPRRCFLKETILQRWLIYRMYSNANDSKYNRLIYAQTLAVLSVLSLFGYLALAMMGK